MQEEELFHLVFRNQMHNSLSLATRIALGIELESYPIV